MAQDEEDEPASKAEFVWLMAELGRRDRKLYRVVRESGWSCATERPISADGKSEKPN